MNPNNQGRAERPDSELHAELKLVEARLAALSPRDDRLDRERLMFLAGQASVQTAYAGSKNELAQPPVARFWRAAFAGMTAAAATLFALLLTRPAVVEPPGARVRDMATTTLPTESPRQISRKRTPTRGDVLSASDVLRYDYERLLSTRRGLPTDGDAAAWPRLDGLDRPTLTPAAWQQFLNRADSAEIPQENSTSLPAFHGVNS